MGLNFTMRIIFLSIFFAGISINAQFTYPEVKIQDPVQELDTREVFENRIIGNKAIKEIQTTEKTDSKTEIQIKKFDKKGNIIFSSKVTELPPGRDNFIPPGLVDFPQAGKSEYNTTLSDGRIISYKYSSDQGRPRKSEIFYDAENNISKIKEPDQSSEYFYEKGKLSKAITFIGASQQQSSFQYNTAGKMTSSTNELIFPNGQSKSSSITFDYDKTGNILVYRYKNPGDGGIIEKHYTYKNNSLATFLYTIGKNIKEQRTYEYDRTGKLTGMTKTGYDFGSNVVKDKAVFQYRYKNDLISEIIRIQGFDNRKATYTDVFSYDNQNRLANIKTKAGNNVFTNIDIVYGKNTITLNKEKSQSVYTLYE